MNRYVQKFRRLISGTHAEIATNPTAEKFEVNKWELSDFVLQKLVPVVDTHPFPLDELMLLVGTVCRFKPTHIFEWGTNIGKSARIFYETSKHFQLPLEIHSIDLPDDIEHAEHPKTQRGKLVRGLSGVFLHLGDGVETAVGIYRALPPESRVLFFVDGDHSYESVQRELHVIFTNVAFPKVLLHDTFFQSSDAGYNVGPHRAVDEFLGSDAGLGVTRLELSMGLPGMTLLSKSEA